MARQRIVGTAFAIGAVLGAAFDVYAIYEYYRHAAMRLKEPWAPAQLILQMGVAAMAGVAMAYLFFIVMVNWDVPQPVRGAGYNSTYANVVQLFGGALSLVAFLYVGMPFGGNAGGGAALLVVAMTALLVRLTKPRSRT